MVALLLASILSLSANSEADTPGSWYVNYTVSGRALSIVSAVTPYDSDQTVRDSFLHWFQRGFEGVIAGEAPLMIEWQDTPQGDAGQKGYEIGLDEGEAYMKNQKSPNPSPQISRTARFDI